MKLGRRMSAVLLGSAVVLATPAAAMANEGPDDTTTYEVTRSGANSMGSWTMETNTCAGSNGEEASYERTMTRTNANGESTTIVRSGEQSACAQANEENSSDSDFGSNNSQSGNVESNSAESNQGILGGLFSSLFGTGGGNN